MDFSCKYSYRTIGWAKCWDNVMIHQKFRYYLSFALGERSKTFINGLIGISIKRNNDIVVATTGGCVTILRWQRNHYCRSQLAESQQRELNKAVATNALCALLLLDFQLLSTNRTFLAAVVIFGDIWKKKWIFPENWRCKSAVLSCLLGNCRWRRSCGENEEDTR